MAEQLAADVRADLLSFDTGTMGCEANHRYVQQELSRYGGDWIVVLEDDAQPVGGFREQAAAALAAAPAPIVSFYLGYSHPEWNHMYPVGQAIRDNPDACWLTHARLLHAVGYAIRTDLLPLRLDTNGHAIDTAIGNWAIVHGHLVAYTVPSLVDHADTTPVVTTRTDSRPRSHPRKAWRCGTRGGWTSKAAAL